MSAFVNLKPANELDASQTPELLIKAINDSFEGELVLTTQDSRQVAFQFTQGVLVRSQSPFGRRSFITALAEHLPAEQIALAEAHAREHRVDEFTAVERLQLLPPLSLARLLQESLQRELILLAHGIGTLHYRFADYHAPASQPKGAQSPAPQQGTEPLVLITETLLESPYLSRCRELLLPSLRMPLVLQGRALDARMEMRGHLRQIVSSLRRQPESLDNLRLRRVASEPALVAAVYALRSTGCISLEASAEVVRTTSGAQSGAPAAVRRASTSGVREIALPGHAGVDGSAARGLSSPDSVPPGSNATTPSSRSLTPSSRGTPHVDEHVLEQSALDAWMRAMDNHGLAKKALKVAERSAARAPRNPNILYYYGCLLSLNANYLEAEVALRRVLNLEPDHVEARHELSKIEKLEKGPGKQGLLSRWVGRKS